MNCHPRKREQNAKRHDDADGVGPRNFTLVFHKSMSTASCISMILPMTGADRCSTIPPYMSSRGIGSRFRAARCKVGRGAPLDLEDASITAPVRRKLTHADLSVLLFNCPRSDLCHG